MPDPDDSKMGTLRFLLEVVGAAAFIAMGLLMAVWPATYFRWCVGRNGEATSRGCMESGTLNAPAGKQRDSALCSSSLGPQRLQPSYGFTGFSDLHDGFHGLPQSISVMAILRQPPTRYDVLRCLCSPESTCKIRLQSEQNGIEHRLHHFGSIRVWQV